jgi:hypothetical protein
MRFVIDSNQLQSHRLRAFLSKSSSNQAVLTDFVAMEAYKGDTLTSIYKSMAIVSEFPNQALILKGSKKLLGTPGRRKGLQRRLIDESQTKHFPQFVRELRLAQEGNVHMQQHALEHGRAADEHFSKMLAEAEAMRPVIDYLGTAYSRDERAILRSRDSYTPEMMQKVVNRVFELAGRMFRGSPLIHRRPSHEELPNTYFFRVALACYLMAISRSAHGSVCNVRPDKLRNDLVDMMLVAYGTYFDGILSEDEGVNSMFRETCVVLARLRLRPTSDTVAKHSARFIAPTTSA